METYIGQRNVRLMMAVDLLLFLLGYYGAYLLRFEGDLPPIQVSNFLNTLMPIVLIKMVFAYGFGLYRGMWRYTGIRDFMNVLKFGLAATLTIVAIILFDRTITNFSRMVFILDAILTMGLVAGFRIAIRLYFTGSLRNLLPARLGRGKAAPNARRMLIAGAGDEGEKVLREFLSAGTKHYRIIGFTDDDPAKIGKYIHGTPVLGNTDLLPDILDQYQVDEVLIAKSTATAQEIRHILKHAERKGVPCKTIPSVSEFVDGTVSLKSIRDVAFEDLLGREPVQLDMDQIGAYLKDKSILVTGAGGSIGSELCRQIARFQPAALGLLDRAESPLYEMQMEFQHYQSVRIPHCPYLVGVQNKAQLRKVFLEAQPEVVFHAAAYKHVPMLELQPWEAIFNNIVATRNMLEMCREFPCVKRFVFVSTDKAVRPTNVMGATKRIAELLVQRYDALNPNATHQAVRFGNVVGSAGSVIPLFKKQIERRQAVTVTDPEVTRYFMTIPEAAQLILQAGAMGTGGEIFILDMGSPIKIVDLARDLIRLSGFEPEVDIPIEFIGLRPGEKRYEELITQGEGIVKTDHQRILVLRADNGEDQRGGEALLSKLHQDIDELIQHAHHQDAPAIKAKLHAILPEYIEVTNGRATPGDTS